MPAWGRYTVSTSKGRAFAHIFEWPKDRKLALTGVKDKPRSVYLLADRKPLTLEQTAEGWAVQLPAVRPSAISSVLVLETGSGR